MGFDDGQLGFDSPTLTYYPGQTVFGRVMFTQDKVKTFRGLFVKIKGFCDVHWTTSHTRRVNNRNETYTKHHNSHETYFENKIYLMGSDNGEVHLQPGYHDFPYQCQIPINSPSSYEGGYGHVRYEVKVVVDRAFKFDQEKHVTLTVLSGRDLNANPYCKQPMAFNFKESYCCCCVTAGKCEVVAHIPQSGFCPGQTIKIELDCFNRSNVEIDAIVFEIKETVEFRATHEPGTRYDKNVIAKLNKGPIPENTTRHWELEFEVPQMDVRNLDTCSYIDIDYKLKVTVSPSGCHSSTSASAGLVLGTIPLRDLDTPVPLAEYPTAQLIDTNQAYPAHNQAYASPNQAYPPPNQAYPPPNQAYPPPNQAYPPPNQAYPSPNQPYPAVTPYPPGNQPFSTPVSSAYPGGLPPYPGGNQPFPGGNQPYPGGNQPFPGGNQPYPGGNQPYPPPYPNVTPMQDFQAPPGHENKDGVKVPLLPPTAAVPYPIVQSPYATASAPEPSTPDSAGDKMLVPASPAHNPEKSDSTDKN